MIAQQRIGRILWQGLTFGPGSRYHVTALEGVDDLPGLRTADVPQPTSDGDILGEDYAAPRTVVLGLGLRGDTPDHLRQLIEGLRAVTGVGAAGWLEFSDLGVAVEARLRRRSLPYDAGYLWTLGDAVLELVCGDPRLYALAEQTASTGLPVAEAGLDWTDGAGGLDWTGGDGGLDWGGGGSTGDIVAVNSGGAAAHPVIEITGPVQTPSLRSLTTGRVLEYDLAVGAGETLTVDTRSGRVLLAGADRLGSVSNRSTPEQLFVLPPGESVLAFRSLDPAPTAATCVVRWRSAAW